MNSRHIIFLLIFIFPGTTAYAGDHIWIVGGGASLHSSQAQIELNVKWEREVILRQTDKARLQIFYTDGDKPESDILAWQAPTESPAMLQPLARVFDAQNANGERFYNHTIPGVTGSTRATELVARLRKEFSQLKAGDRALFIFYGHGTRNSKDIADNALRLWGDTLLSARDLEKILSEINPAIPVRWVLPQCYSGGFARIMHPGAQATRTLVPHNRCGFMSVADDRESEGCTPSINIGDFRDYSTYFFAALDGRTRLGKKLAINPDLDANGYVSLREAHFYSMANAVSTDLPRATSEVYLEEWQPWYLRWLGSVREPGNIYGKLAQKVAATNALPVRGRELIQAVSAAYQQHNKDITVFENERIELKKTIKPLQQKIRTDLAERWPAVLAPYTYNFYNFLQQELGPAQTFIMRHTHYEDLVRQQERILELDILILATQRKLAQMDKILRLRKLATLLDQFQRMANTDDHAAYQRLISCEESRL